MNASHATEIEGAYRKPLRPILRGKDVEDGGPYSWARMQSGEHQSTGCSKAMTCTATVTSAKGVLEVNYTGIGLGRRVQI